MKKKTNNKVYFIQDQKTGWVKIGKSLSPKSRMKTLQSGSCSKLILRKTITGGLYLEHILHGYFAPDRKHNEWFKPSYELKMFINNKRKISINSIVSYFEIQPSGLSPNLRKYLEKLNDKRQYL